MNNSKAMTRNRLLTIVGCTMLPCLLTLGAFSLPIGIPLCAGMGLTYGIRYKDKTVTRYAAVALAIGIVCIAYAIITIKSM